MMHEREICCKRTAAEVTEETEDTENTEKRSRKKKTRKALVRSKQPFGLKASDSQFLILFSVFSVVSVLKMSLLRLESVLGWRQAAASSKVTLKPRRSSCWVQRRWMASLSRCSKNFRPSSS